MAISQPAELSVLPHFWHFGGATLSQGFATTAAERCTGESCGSTRATAAPAAN